MVELLKHLNNRNQTKTKNLTKHLVFRHIEEGRGQNVALTYKGNNISYESIAKDISKLAKYMEERGLKKSDPILLLATDTPAFVITLFAALAIGAIAIPLNPLSSLETIIYIAQHVNARFIFASIQYYKKFLPLERLSSVQKVIQMGDFFDELGSLEKSLSSFEDFYKVIAPLEEDIAYCLFSSGTTGKPKGIPRRHSDILFCAKAYAETILKMNTTDSVLAVPKLSFGYALGGNLLFSFLYGGRSILFPETSLAPKICELIVHTSPTILLMQPRMISDILNLNPKPETFSNVKVIASAGENLSPTLYKKWIKAYNIPILDGFGSTEVGHIFISNSMDSINEGSVGKILPGYTTKIIDNQAQEVKRGEVGRLCISGESVASQYFNDEERSKRVFKDGWHISNDLFYENKGCFYSVGRADEMIKTGCGEWISPIEIEEAISTHPAVKDSAVVGTHDKENVIRLKAFVVCHEEHSPNQTIVTEIKNFIEEKWADFPYKHLHEIEFVSELPKTASGKLQRFMLQSKTLTDFSYEC